ncbi:threonine aldolase family protein [Streptomyces subrutilus]|uniref:Threonine aldolase n=1 Tax=Streptomyces subrutilus TaxID=36818 RepID=A0A5P2UXS9_9ACTN|nr:GntG family PLP-dependent aldolase [Streptomyces subrutilus]QEU82321.1 low specificity L-threonine aldolase [Streptomyces subrutilus]WSJ28228.1 beta-eliminating lyase-related protein [Streptomyces subrutilus]GGZ69906.1 threonine aldolase [Streptomyces subrutilus]
MTQDDPQAVVDLRSDTVTRPGPGMRAAMAGAEVGDDLFGEDPTVRALEERLAGLFGFPAALFVPSGVMANQIGLQLLVGPGEELVCEAEAHVLAHEEASPARYGGIQTRTVSAERGVLTAAALAGVVRRGNPYTLGTRAVEVEQTHTRAGGTVHPLETLHGIRELTARAGLAVHMDGARIWNAMAATGTSAAAYGATVDSLAVCLSKGLGAPVGSVLLLAAEHLPRARRLRHGLGGGMRQSGILAAAGLYALDHHVERVHEDHAHAGLLARGLRDAGFAVRPPETNIVLVEVPGAEAITARAAEEGVRVTAPGPDVVRLVTHLDVGGAACRRAVEVLVDVMTEHVREARLVAPAGHW